MAWKCVQTKFIIFIYMLSQFFIIMCFLLSVLTIEQTIWQLFSCIGFSKLNLMMSLLTKLWKEEGNTERKENLTSSALMSGQKIWATNPCLLLKKCKHWVMSAKNSNHNPCLTASEKVQTLSTCKLLSLGIEINFWMEKWCVCCFRQINVCADYILWSSWILAFSVKYSQREM